MIEVPGAALAAARRSPEDLEAMRAGLFDPRGDPLETRLTQHRVFHLALAKASGNPLCELTSRALYPVVDANGRSRTVSPDFWVRMDAEHRDILAAVAAANPSGAAGAARRHLAHLRAEFDGDVAWSPADPVFTALTGAL
jgi:DNA-binding FadR family transcriptional regulator